ncbi:MAG TPA: hypothetical protein VJS38_04170 [Phenylobacterium sp.]|uniref:hypothetical protein n=1 Tax=Phenylobacterium sp. TaxID=1871053 RepID=UPI002B474552|nr:hypothetical protein [Phenylobacterium sp.]HKR87347.1 hypothetical protein [Phenylobacterium sp.]
MADENLHDQLSVHVEGEDVLLQMPGGAARRLVPDMADELAQQLIEAADRARGGTGAPRPRPPFPPSELVSPHGAG